MDDNKYPERLRELSMESWLSEVNAIMLEESADEIERLRKERDGYRAYCAGLSQDVSNSENKLKELHKMVHLMGGYISTTQHFENRHPWQVVEHFRRETYRA